MKQSIFEIIRHEQLTETVFRMVLKGDIPIPIDAPKGCRFCTRCPYATEKCRQDTPELHACGENHFVACHFPGVGME